MNKNANKTICPSCKKHISDTDEKKYLPFCSKRCKMIDLGQWLSEKYVIESDTLEEDISNEQED